MDFAEIQKLFTDPSTASWVFAVIAAILTGLGKAGLGGLGIVIVPIMAMIFPTGQSVGILLPMLVAGDIFAVIFYRRHAVWKEVFTALPLAIIGIILGWLFMRYANISNQLLSVLIGAIVLLMLGIGFVQSLLQRRKKDGVDEDTNGNTPPATRPWGKIIPLGILGGFTSMAANAAGPVFTLYMLYLGLSKKNFIGTWAWLFLMINLIKVPPQWDLGNITPLSLQFNLLMIPAIFIGFIAGFYLIKIIPQEKFMAIIKFMAALGAAKMILG